MGKRARTYKTHGKMSRVRAVPIREVEAGKRPAAEAPAFLRDVITAGPSPLPRCPSCQRRMKARTSGKGSKRGQRFYGCTGYPKCRETLPIV